ncbi:outer membrane protein TolC [Pseudomonas hunanensis]|nr:outer membrane protein TolC [Pseudomonas hunanensis]
MSRASRIFAVSVLALAVTGCAVKTQPIDRSVSEQRARADLASMFKGQEALQGPLTLHQAMARAVKYNLEARLKIMEEALAQRQVDLATFDMLPRMALSAGYAGAQQCQCFEQPERADQYPVP